MLPIDIVFVCDESYSLFSGEFSRGRFGGAGLQMYFLANEIARDPDFRIHWLLLDHPADGLNADGITFHKCIPPIKRGVPVLSRYLNRALKRKMLGGSENPIVVTTLPSNLIRVFSVLGAMSAKVVFRIASNVDLVQPFGFSEDSKIQYFGLLERCSALMAQTNYQCDQALEMHSINATFAGNGITVKGIANQYNRSKILWVASSHYAKQPWYFIDLARIFPEQDFVMICPPQFADALRFVHKLGDGLKNLTIIDEQITYEQVEEYMRESILFINTSNAEGFPNTFLQAWANGCPILSYSFDPDGILEQHGLGLCAQGNIEQFVALCRSLITDSELRESYAERGLQWVAQNHNIELIAERYKEVFRAINENGKPPIEKARTGL